MRTFICVFSVVAWTGCSGGPDTLPPQGSGFEQSARPEASSGSTTSGGADGAQAECIDFQTRECVIDLGVTDGVHNCAKGTQICESGTWTECAVQSP
jgi:hypothetical protein